MSTRDCGLDPQDSLSCNFLSAREHNQARLGLDSLSSWREAKSDRGGWGSALLPEDSVGQLNDSSRQIYSIVFTLILIHSITQMEIFTKIFLLCNKNIWASILYLPKLFKRTKFFKKCISGRKWCQQVTNEIFSTFQSRIFSLKTPRYFLEEDKKKCN